MDSAEQADAAARYQVVHCKYHHPRNCQLETCNLARHWLALRQASLRTLAAYNQTIAALSYNLALKAAATLLEEQGANQKWATMIMGLRKSTPTR
jgi:hypothetical protein